MKNIRIKNKVSIDSIDKNLIEYNSEINFNGFRKIVLSKCFKCKYDKKTTIFTYEDNLKNKDNENIYYLSKQDFTQLLIDLYEDFIKNFCQNTRKNEKSVKTFNFKKFKIISPILFVIFIFCFFIPYVNLFFKCAIILYYSICIFIKSYFLIIGCLKRDDFDEESNKKIEIDEEKLKQYTILVPIFKENKKTIQQLLNAIKKIDYPKDLLDIKLVLEEDDIKTIEILNTFELPEYFIKILVPKFDPRTKPKACNVASLFAEGENLVIFDAEDIPDKEQILKASDMFFNNEKANILQGCLSFYNYNYNILTECFNIEYTVWFKIILKIFAEKNITIPLGGTTNYIKYSFLQKHNFWDSYNVTEDLELSVIANKYNSKISHLNSDTKEWCVVDIKSFIKQRTRWIKGYLLTYLIHFFDFKSFKNINNFIFAHVIIGYTSLSFLFLPFLFISLYSIDNMFLINLWTITNAFYYITYCFIYYSLIKNIDILIKLKRIFVFIIYPFYFILHTISAWIAFFEIFYKPFYWAKTNHLNR